MKVQRLFLLISFISVVLWSCSKDELSSQKKIAIICSDSDQGYAELLNQMGFYTKIIKDTKIDSSVLKTFDLIIAYTDQESYLAEFNSRLSALIASNKPIIAMGEKTTYLFKSMDLISNNSYGVSAQGNMKSIAVLNPENAIWNYPFKVNTKGDTVNVYTSLSSNYAVTALYLPNPETGVICLGKIVNNSAPYYILTKNNNWFLWGFGYTPASNLTNNGKKLFLNVVFSMIQN